MCAVSSRKWRFQCGPHGPSRMIRGDDNGADVDRDRPSWSGVLRHANPRPVDCHGTSKAKCRSTVVLAFLSRGGSHTPLIRNISVRSGLHHRGSDRSSNLCPQSLFSARAATRSATASRAVSMRIGVVTTPTAQRAAHRDTILAGQIPVEQSLAGNSDSGNSHRQRGPRRLRPTLRRRRHIPLRASRARRRGRCEGRLRPTEVS